MTYSYSALSCYERCPRQYYIERMEKRKPPDTRPLRIGSATHMAIAEYIRHLKDEELPTDITWVDEALDRAEQKFNLGRNPLTVEERAEVSSILHTFVHSYSFDPAQIRCVEEEMYITVPIGALKQGFLGIVDYRYVDKNGKHVIVDWKTNWRVAAPAEAKRDFQLHYYAWLLGKLLGCKEVICKLEYVRYGAARSVLIDQRAMEQTERRVLADVEAIETDRNWDPRPGPHCFYCPWISECEIKDTIDSPEEIGRQILMLEAKLKDLQQKLKEHCNAYGPVEVDNEIFGFSPTKDGGWRITDKAAFADMLAKHGLVPWEYFSVDASKLKSIRTSRKHKELLDDIMSQSLLARDINVRFGHHKVEGEESDTYVPED